MLDKVLALKDSQTGGTLPEVTDGLGDSFVHVFREAMDRSPHALGDASKNEWVISLQLAYEQAVLANRWYMAWFFWMEALWADAQIKKITARDWHLILDHDQETIRHIGIWRRQKRIESFHPSRLLRGLVKVASTNRTVVCKWVGNRIVLSTRLIRSGEPSWAERIQGYALLPQYLLSARLLDVELDLSGTSVNMRYAISYYSTLLSLFFELEKVMPERHLARDIHLRDAFCISTSNLINAIGELTEIPPYAVSALVTISTFSATPREILWGRPLVFAGVADRFIFLPALKSSLLRTINHLIDLYAGDNGKKGVFFQEHCRDMLSMAARDGPLREISWISPRPVQTSVGDIDVCMIIGGVLVLAEVKYTGSPSDAYEYWNVDRRLDEGCDQLRRKLQFVNGDRSSFLKALQEKYGAPSLASIGSNPIPLIIASDAYHAGFPLQEIAVSDLAILSTFFDNQYVDAQLISNREVIEHAVPIYGEPSEAARMLETYLHRPEAIKRLLRKLAPRVLQYPTGVVTEDSEIIMTCETVEVSTSD